MGMGRGMTVRVIVRMSFVTMPFVTMLFRGIMDVRMAVIAMSVAVRVALFAIMGMAVFMGMRMPVLMAV